mgnify:FL=1
MENQIKIILKYFNAGNYKRVIEKSQKLQKKYSQSSYLDNLLGSAYLKIGDNKNAKINFESSITKSSENIAALNNLANLEKNNGNYKSAQKIYLKILKLDQNYINALVNYANLKMDMGDSDGAIKTLTKAITIDPSNYIALFNLATAYLTLGQKTKSLKYALKSSEINPNFTSIDKLISVIKTYNKDDDHFIKMKNKLNDLNINQFNKIYLNFAIAKAYKDMGENRKFIEHIITGNALKKKISNYDIKKDINLLNNIKLVFKNIDYSKVQLSNNNKKIIFVVGMPRSGTSLVEQILSSHSKIYGAGELPFLKQTILKKFNKEFFMHDSFSNLNEISKNYIENISFLSGTNEYILDKNPLNFIWIGFIKLLFPNAKIIHIKRNSKDTCFSCFKELFENLHFTHDQYDLSTFYNSYIDLMNFWNSSLKNYIHTVNYEDLVDSTKSNVIQMLKFCELDFEENCLNFKENKSAVRTISISQVRNPIYKSSVGSYKYYEENLKVLFDNLK